MRSFPTSWKNTLSSLGFRKKKKATSRKANRSLRSIEQLEDRRLLAIVWANELDVNGNLDPSNGFSTQYSTSAAIAQSIVNRAIDDWNNVIIDQDFDNDSNPSTNTFVLEVFAEDLGAGTRGAAYNTTLTTGGAGQAGWDVGIPMSATVSLDNDGGGTGWFFDDTPLDDAEFSSIAGSFQSSFIDATTLGQSRQNDLYRTIVHEIGHAIGVGLNDQFSLDSNNYQYASVRPDSADPSSPAVTFQLPLNVVDGSLGALTNVGIDQIAPVRIQENVFNPNSGTTEDYFAANELWQYTFGDGSGRTITFTEAGGGHFYEGDEDPAFPGADRHENELMNSGRTIPGSPTIPFETTRQFISDLTVDFLKDVYGYITVSPSTFATAHASLDTQGGTLLVQGSPRDNNGVGVDDVIEVTVLGENIRVEVDTPTLNAVRLFARSEVQQIVIAGHGGNDNISVAGELDPMWKEIEYVVSSNQDAVESANSLAGGVLGDGVVDLNTDLSGSQTTLRAAIRDANSAVGGGSIYLAPNPGNYVLNLNGNDSTAAVGDLDITGDILIVGAGAGLSVIDGGSSGDRVFEAHLGASLDLSRLTVTGGNASSSGGGLLMREGSTVNVDEVAVVDNVIAAGAGGGIFNKGGSLTVTNSVVSGNTRGGITSKPYGTTNPFVMGNTIIADNTATNLFVESTPTTRSLGNNLVDVAPTWSEFGAAGDATDTSGANYIVTSLADQDNGNDDDFALSLREAIIKSNSATGQQSVWLPAFRHTLSRTGSDNAAAVGDLDITGDVSIVGVGAGLSVIDGGSSGDRVFEARPNASLDLSRLTVTGGLLSGGSGGGLLLRQDSTTTLNEVAVVDNFAPTSGGGIFAQRANLTVTNSVVSGNTGGGIVGNGYTTPKSFVMGSSIVADNTGTNLSISNSVGSSLGNNLVDVAPAWSEFGAAGDATDTSGANYIVTSLADQDNGNDDDFALSLREAIIESNSATGQQSVWLPAFRHTLALTDTTDTASVGDLDITGDVSIVGVGAGLSVIDGGSSGDRVFEAHSNASLDLSRLTVTGGDASSSGGGLLMREDSTVTVDEVAIVDNAITAGAGGGIFNKGGSLTLTNSVVSGNTGGGITSALYGGTNPFAMSGTIIVNNTGTNLSVEMNTPGSSGGRNIIDETTNWSEFGTAALDLVQSNVDDVITSVADSVFPSDDEVSLTIRDAVIAANATTAEELLLVPGWTFGLHRSGTGGAEIGTIDIEEDLLMLGISGQTTIDATDILDDVFAEIGDIVFFANNMTIING